MHTNFLLEETTWNKEHQSVRNVNPGFADVIDALGLKAKLVKIRYPFGADIVKNGVFQLPNAAGKIVPITDPSIPNSLKESLGYNNGGPPLMILVRNGFVAYDDFRSRIIPIRVIPEGKIFSIWPILDYLAGIDSRIIECIWTVGAGAKSLIMLPKIADKTGYLRLKKEFHVDVSTPKDLRGYGKLFTTLAQSPNFPDKSWYVEVICFTKDWLKKRKDAGWLNFYCYLLEHGWCATRYWRSQEQWISYFSYMQRERNLRPDPYLVDCVKHLISMADGALPSYSVAIDEKMGPILTFEKIFNEVYGLKEYPPIIMQPSNFDNNTKASIGYYSMKFPTSRVFSPKTKNVANTLRDLLEMKHVYNAYRHTVLLDSKINLKGSVFYKLMEKIKIDFCHSVEDCNHEIRLLQELFASDPAILEVCKRNNKNSFCYSSPFLHGCIRLST